MEIKIGCTGWSYDGWIGTFYPKRIKKSQFLNYYSQFFDITEINTTFYQIPSANITSKWNNQTLPDFNFTAKIPKTITHEKRLKDCKSVISKFLESIFPLGTKLFAIVIQLPPSLTFEESIPRLEEMFDYLPERYLYPVEARHKSWFTKSAISYLEKKKVCLVWNDVKGVENPIPLTSDYVYLRLIGDREIPEERFGAIQRNRDKAIQQWVNKIESIQDKIDFVIVMANNHYEGFAPETANKLKKMLRPDPVLWDAKRQQDITDFIK